MPKSQVYIVDDNIHVLSALKWLFESIHCEVKAYPNALEFLAQYSPKDRGVLIADVYLPKMNGLELLEKIKAEKSLLKVVIITAFGDIAMAIQAIKAGAIDFITKPISGSHLLALLQKCFEENSKNPIVRDEFLTEKEVSFLELMWKESNSSETLRGDAEV